MSKERQLEPQIIIGLLVAQNGFLMGSQSYEGKKAETKTILPDIQDLQTQNGLTKTTIVADGAMMSASNLVAFYKAGNTYIVGSRLHKVPSDIAEYQKTGELSDQQIIVENNDGYRIILQYQTKWAALDMRNIEKQVSMAIKKLNGQVPYTKTRFLIVVA